MELAEDVAEEVLDLIPRVDTVGTIQDNHDVHVCRAPCTCGSLKIFGLLKKACQENILCCVPICGYFALLEQWSLLVVGHR